MQNYPQELTDVTYYFA